VPGITPSFPFAQPPVRAGNDPDADSNSIANSKRMNGCVFGVVVFAAVDGHGLVIVGSSLHNAKARRACAVLM
jgi:hypothetical protein